MDGVFNMHISVSQKPNMIEIHGFRCSSFKCTYFIIQSKLNADADYIWSLFPGL